MLIIYYYAFNYTPRCLINQFVVIIFKYYKIEYCNYFIQID
jgi:hypothetical protein